MDATVRGQVTRSAADAYEEFYLPALFWQWAPRVADAAGLSTGDSVLDVACGTGVVAREAARRVLPGGKVIGLDCNDGMLEVARRMAPDLSWQRGEAESLPFVDAEFDAVLCQFGLMFFEDRVGALKEMWRVMRPGGRLAIAVWDGLEHSPGYAAMADLLQRLFGAQVAEGIRSPFALGNSEELLALFREAGIEGAEVQTAKGVARFPSIESWVRTDVTAWTISDLIDDAEYELLLSTAQEELAPFAQRDGTVVFPAPAHIVTANRS